MLLNNSTIHIFDGWSELWSNLQAAHHKYQTEVNSIHAIPLRVITNSDILALTVVPKKIPVMLVPNSEEAKSVEEWYRLQSNLLEQHFPRRGRLIALGGGVIGDITGFVAATYRRGIEFIQVPTTLLSMIDASVGGKTGINHPLGKNMIGAFHLPVSVNICLEALDTLPEDVYLSGLAEMLKHALISSQSDVDDLLLMRTMILERDKSARYRRDMRRLILRSIQIKSKHVKADPEDTKGIRAFLNLGHTFAHAIERLQKYAGLMHGQAVAIGICMAVKLSHRLGYLSNERLFEILNLFDIFDLIFKMPEEIIFEDFYETMLGDKKNEADRPVFVLMKDIGILFLTDNVDQSDVEIIFQSAFL